MIYRWLALLAAAHTCAGVTVTINNTAPRLDVNGNIMDAHDGSIQRFPGDPNFYMHAVAYGLCQEPARYGCDQTSVHCGFQPNHTIEVWSSPTMASGTWTHVSTAIQPSQRPAGVVFRPDATYNPNTGLYVLWWNWVAANGSYEGYAAATAPSPAGPFTLQLEQVNVTRNNATSHAGDYHLFVDDDGTGYVIYSADFWMSVEELTPDFLHSTGRSSPLFGEYFVEAPTLFKRDGVYYALFGHCCCFCQQGSGLYVHTAPSPLGPWSTLTGDIACEAAQGAHWLQAAGVLADPTPGQGCLYNGSTAVSVTRAQQNYVVRANSSSGMTFIYTGDRWQQSPDGLKGHDPQYWYPLQFNADGSIQDITWQDVITFEV